MMDKVDIEEEKRGDKTSIHPPNQHTEKIDPTKENDSIYCNGIEGVDEEDGGGRIRNGDSAVLRSMLTDAPITSSSVVVGAHHIDGPGAINNIDTDEAIASGGVGVAGTVIAEAPVDVEATPVCPDAWPVDDEVPVAVEVCKDNEQPKRKYVFFGLLTLCAVVAIAIAVPLSRRSAPEEEELATADQALPSEVATMSNTDDDMNVHKAPVPYFISDILSLKYTQYVQGILGAQVSLYGDCRTSVIYNEGMVQTIQYNEMSDEWDVLNELREYNSQLGPLLEIAKVNQVLAVSMPSNDPNNAGSIRTYSLSISDQEWTPIGDNIEGTKPSLSIEGDVLASVVVGADGEGRVRVYRFDTNINNWAQLGSDIAGESSLSRITYVRISQFGDYLVVGADDTVDEKKSSSLRVFRLDNNEEWIKVGNTLHESSSYPLISVRGNTVATSGFDIDGLPRAGIYRYQPNEDEWARETNFDGMIITSMSAPGNRLGMCRADGQGCSIHSYDDISKEWMEVATYTDFVPLHFEQGGFFKPATRVCGIATSNSRTTIGFTQVPW